MRYIWHSINLTLKYFFKCKGNYLMSSTQVYTHLETITTIKIINILISKSSILPISSPFLFIPKLNISCVFISMSFLEFYRNRIKIVCTFCLDFSLSIIILRFSQVISISTLLSFWVGKFENIWVYVRLQQISL